MILEWILFSVAALYGQYTLHKQENDLEKFKSEFPLWCLLCGFPIMNALIALVAWPIIFIKSLKD